ncbi:MAG: hypothetical protein AAF850_03580 [Pseudomonadota bacterium]
MTSEVVLMNRQGVAMAADSAVTISGPQWIKTYNSADKLFPLVEGQPIAVMIYNNAEIMSTPWETVISLYREQTRGRPLDTVEDYAADFMAFLSGNPDLFSADHQDTEMFKHFAVVMSIVAEEFDHQVRDFQQSNGGRLRDHLSSILEYVIGHIHASYLRSPDDRARGELACFPRGTDEKIRRRYANEINQLIEQLVHTLRGDYGGLQLSEASRQQLRDIAVFSVTKDAFFEHYTGVVFAGFGSRDAFPAMRSYLTSTVVLGILKHRQDRARDMAADRGPVVEPFAQDRMIRTFLEGMDPYLRMYLYGESLKLSVSHVSDVVSRAPALSDAQRKALLEDYSQNNLGAAVRSFFQSIDQYQQVVHTRPIYRAIGSLPKRELGETAASLIKLNSFQQRVMHSIETVGGPIDVAVITRNGGLELRRDKPDF